MRGHLKALAGVLVIGTGAALLGSACIQRVPKDVAARRVIILGLDGMDHGLVSTMIAQGRLPNIARLQKMGGFQALGSAVPPQSPVAWSDFITGMDAGGHGIYDFIHRDPKTMKAYMSTSRTTDVRTWSIGKWQLPLSGGKVELLRRGQAFWEALEKRGIHTEILRIPANYPPSGTASIELSGMGTPDLLGGYGVFSYYTTDRLEFLGRKVSGGEVFHSLDNDNGKVECRLMGPDNPYLAIPKDTLEPERYRMSAGFTVYLDPDQPLARIVLGGEERILREGEWSDWVPFEFSPLPLQSVRAQVRFYLKRVKPEMELYASPLNIDPEAPAQRISTPDSFAGVLSRATGRYYTQGMPENTGALSAHVLSTREFLDQAEIAGQEALDEFPYMLSRFKSGVLFYYIGNNDLISHMMWRPMDPGHPAYDAATDAAFADVVPKTYEKLDRLVGYALDHMGANTLLVVMSDHGFASWRRVFHLNAWLKKEGYLATYDGEPPEKREYMQTIDFTRTRAYAFGLNGLYINLKGREKEGIVPPEERRRLIDEISAKLKAVLDPVTKGPSIGHVYVLEDTYMDAGQRAIGEGNVGPDMVVGYAKGTRGSDDSALGGVEGEIWADNDKPWSGDHCMDTPDVPGILAVSRPLKRPVARLKDLAGALLEEFDIHDFPSAVQSKRTGS